MRRLIFTSIVLATLFGFAEGESEGVYIRGSGSGRVWQTNFAPDEPLVWRWGKASVATFAVIDHCAKRSSSATVNRSGSEIYGSWTLPPPRDFSADRDYLYDITLVLSNAAAEVGVETARIARLANAADRNVTVRSPLDSDWGLSPTKSAVLAYDSAWTTGAVASVTLAATRAGVTTTDELEGAAGFQPLVVAVGAASQVEATLQFDSLAYSSVLLRYLGKGFALIFK